MFERMTARRHTWARALAGATWLLLAAPRLASAQAAGAPALPADPRLTSVRAPLEEILARAAKDGLPADLIASKVREGLAKGVAPEAIRGAAERLAGSLDGAARFLRTQRGPQAATAGAAAPSPLLIRAVAEANLAGVEAEGLLPLVASKDSDAVVARAIEVVTDLTMRGYPSRRSGVVVRDIADRDARSLGRVVAGVESIRAEQTVSRADALEVLGRNFRTGAPSLDTAVARALEGGDRTGNASGISPGKSGEAPGHTGNTGAAKIKKPKR
jgi:hypothetical protein